MIGHGTEKLHEYARTGSSKKSAINAAAEAVALSGHCVGSISGFSWSTSLKFFEILRWSVQSVRLWGYSTARTVDIPWRAPSTHYVPISFENLLYVPNTYFCMYLGIGLGCKQVSWGGIRSVSTEATTGPPM